MSRSTTKTTVPKTSLQPSSVARQNEQAATVLGLGGGSTNVTTSTSTEPLTADVEAGPSSEGLKIEAVAVDEDSENLRIREIEQRYAERLERLARGEDPDTGETIRSPHRRSSSSYVELKCSKNQIRIIKIVLLAVGVIAIAAIAIGLLVSGSKDDIAVVSSSNTTNDQVDQVATSPPSTQTGFSDQCYGKHEPPITECTYVETATNLPNQQTYNRIFVILILDLSTNSPYGEDVTDDKRIELVYEDVRNTFQSKLIPIIAGCRYISDYQPQEPPHGVINDGYLEKCHPNRLMVANGFVPPVSTVGDCNSDAQKPCLRIEVPLELYLKGDSTFRDFRELMLTYFGSPLIDLIVTASSSNFTKHVKLHSIFEE